MSKVRDLIDRPIPNPSLGNVMQFWNDGGNFNTALYIRICAIKSNKEWIGHKDKSKD